MKILFAINDLKIGGGQRTVVEEANGLYEKGHAVYLLTTLPKDKDNRKDNLFDFLFTPAENIINIPFKSFFDFSAYSRLHTFIKKTGPDAIISNLFFTNTIVRLLKIFSFGKWKILVREGNVPVEKSFLARIVDRILSLVTSKFIVNAGIIKKELVKIGIPEKKIEVIYNGISESFFNAPVINKEEMRRSLGISEDAVVIISVGTLHEQKGHKYLIDAFGKLNRENVYLLLAGDGPLYQNLKLQITNYLHTGDLPKGDKLGSRVRLLGTRDDIKELLHASDVFVLSSLWEGMPNAMLEAMAVGLPVVVTRVGGVPEIIKDGDNGLLVEPEDAEGLKNAILKLIENPTLRRDLSAKAKETARGLTWEKHIEGLLEVIRT